MVKRRILYLTTVTNPLLTALAREVQRDPSLDVEVLNVVAEARGRWLYRVLSRVPRLRGALLVLMGLVLIRARARSCDLCHIHYCDRYYRYWIALLARRAVVVSIWGSDFAAAPAATRRSLRSVFDRAKWITFSSENLRDEFLAWYGRYDDRTTIARFGLDLLPLIRQNLDRGREAARSSWGFGPRDFVVVCGSYASDLQNQDAIVEAVHGFADSICGLDPVFVFPLSYGDRSYRARLMAQLQNEGSFRWKVIVDWLSDERLAALRVSTDVHLNFMKADQLSGAMQEAMYAGTIVIVGDWLSYDALDSRGASFHRLHSFAELPGALRAVMADVEGEREKASRNRAIIDGLSAWERNTATWRALYL